MKLDFVNTQNSSSTNFYHKNIHCRITKESKNVFFTRNYVQAARILSFEALAYLRSEESNSVTQQTFTGLHEVFLSFNPLAWHGAVVVMVNSFALRSLTVT